MTNACYYAVGYPIFKVVQWFRGKSILADLRGRWEYKEVHVNEQNLTLMGSEYRQIRFKVKIWFHSYETYIEENILVIWFFLHILTKVYPFRYFSSNNLFATATNP